MSETRKTEQGGGTISSIIWLLVFVGVLYAMWNVAPAYIAQYNLQDKMVEVARVGRSTNPDDKILSMLMKKVNEEGLQYFIKANNFEIVTTETNRRIRVQYDRELKVLPGYTRKVHFDYLAEQPVAF
jgi:hypothetical protein